jgi:anaerobic magnesium-protoporphyrin IX monomethyl ester cyclase
MKIVLINAPVKRPSPHARLSPPLGLAYIASALLKEGHDVRAIDFNISGLNYGIIERMAEKERPAIVGISAQTETFNNALRIAERIKFINKEVTIVMGGPHPSLLPAQVLESCAVDFVVTGEGERTIVELAYCLFERNGKFDNIRGLAYREKGVVINEGRESSDPEELPYPARELFPIEFYQEKWNIATARGSCPYKCPFCSASQFWHGRRKPRSPENIVDEIGLLKEKYDINYVFFTDDVFTLNRNWVYGLVDSLRSLDRPILWGCATRVDLVDQELLKDMAHAGCRAIQFGVESGSQKILDSVKGINKEQALRAVKAAIQSGMKVASSFMIPFPNDTPYTINETKEFIKVLYRQGSKILLSYTTPYPGTLFHEKADTLGIKILANDWEEFDSKHNIIETKHLSAEQIDKLVGEIATEVGLERNIY